MKPPALPGDAVAVSFVVAVETEYERPTLSALAISECTSAGEKRADLPMRML
jgi:hypothetical protein